MHNFFEAKGRNSKTQSPRAVGGILGGEQWAPPHQLLGEPII